MLTYTQPRQSDVAATHRCRRCGTSHFAADIAVCIGCRAQEQVTRHIPPAGHWFRSR
jgi:ribosomal protein L37E